MSKPRLPDDQFTLLSRVANKQRRDEAGTPTVESIKDPQGRIRVSWGAFPGPRYGLRVYDATGAVVYDYTTP